MKLEPEVEQSCCAVHVDLRDLAHPCQRQRHHRQRLPHLQQQPIYWSQLTMAPQMMQCCPPLMPRYSEIQEKTITTKLGCQSYIPSLCPRVEGQITFPFYSGGWSLNLCEDTICLISCKFILL